MRKVAIWDLDGTLINNKHRLHHIQCEQPNWKAFDAARDGDTVYEPARAIYTSLAAYDVWPFIFTARPERTRVWLKQYMQRQGLMVGLPNILMRADCDNRPHELVKEEMLHNVIKDHHVLMAFEDNPACVAMFRRNGIMTWAACDKDWQHKHALSSSVDPFEPQPHPRPTSQDIRNGPAIDPTFLQE